MKNNFWFKLVKSLVINTIGVVILFKTIAFAALHEYNEISILGWIALFILAVIGLHFIRQDYTRPNDKELAEIAIGGFIYALKRKHNDIEENEYAERMLNDTPVGEAVKKFINNEEQQL